ncbi:uncharacterized protein PV09_07253 [Verruconis gallopava]|uniref:Peptidase S33 tripeptidyl aminopeptidase-like C-terminal domain-containing protein n=1 Tax=Verruconis gallopava TaxID=253628 RepID=A0A0D2A407_9PEZI|nr:uncharacterized protein PV09_07253 [Verruconis gallopava]KIW01205.1 hypothetical protein PV09_07253 [Verruconis gallopava]
MDKTRTFTKVGQSIPFWYSWHVFFRHLTLFVAVVLVLSNGFRWITPQTHVFYEANLSPAAPFEWSRVNPTKSFGFVSCYGEYECARLDVPLDWTASTEVQGKQRAGIAVIRLPAKVPVTSPRYGGAILINPGGPGGSGVNMLLSVGRQIQKVVDTGSYSSEEDGTNQMSYDIIGFDPRGVNHTTPSPSCFPDDVSRQFWDIGRKAAGSLGENSTFPLVWSRNKALAESCSRTLREQWDGIGMYMNTPQVASDMVAIIEALGEWREKQAQEQIRKMKQSREQVAEIEARTRWNKSNESLLFMGFSYGTLLGSTFATLFPEKVNRLVLDGVCDADDYYSGTWLSNLLDTDLIIGSFFRQCHEAGPVECPLWSANGVDGIRVRYHGVLDRLKSSPLPVEAFGTYSADVITVSDAMDVVREAVYQPMKFWPTLASVFDQLDKGNGSELAAAKQDGRISYCRSPTCVKNPYSDDCYAHNEGFREELSAAILCTDGPADQLKWKSEDHFAKWHALRGQSRALGDFWAEITMFCANWNVRPRWNFTYPTTSRTTSVNTSFPILFASTVRDPVTPLRNAKKMQTRFSGAGLLTVEADGHCTIGVPSLCAARTISAYFQKGDIPADGLVCAPDSSPFDRNTNTGTLERHSRELLEALDHIQRHTRASEAMPLGIL